MKLSIIIVNYNVAYFLEQCLKSVEVAVQEMDAVFGANSCEVFVVDNNSVDGSQIMVQQKFPSVILIDNKKNVGFSKANNQAMRISKGEYVLLLNPDTLVETTTFTKVVKFMDQHPDAGGLGVQMIDGKGKFLPESKRGLPTPWVAFYKIFGFSKLFPKSKKFGRYHLTYLSKEETHEIEVLSGAFMLMRNEALQKVGLLDEDYFMYGEDIDLSYRIIKGGYKNYYFPDTKIIHYKGESTKKGSVNYVFVFYRAMIIFARKHFNQKHAKAFSFLINFAIYLRASLAILNRFVKKSILHVADFAILYTILWFIGDSWAKYYKHYDESFDSNITQLLIPIYILIWMITMYYNGGNDKPYSFKKIVTSALFGTGIILVLYALLPEQMRFSRAVILMGTAASIAVFTFTRLVSNYIQYKNLSFNSAFKKRTILVGDLDECERVMQIMQNVRKKTGIIGFVNAKSTAENGFLAGFNQLSEIITIHKINEVIFCAKSLSAETIIQTMSDIEKQDIEYKIAPIESDFIIGSNSINHNGELYTIDLNTINLPQYKRLKRLVDVMFGALFLLLFPIGVLLVKNPIQFLKNIFKVLGGKYSWVGYAPTAHSSNIHLPKIKPGIVHPVDVIQKEISEDLKQKLNISYVKNYRPVVDVNIILKSIRKLGNK